MLSALGLYRVCSGLAARVCRDQCWAEGNKHNWTKNRSVCCLRCAVCLWLGVSEPPVLPGLHSRLVQQPAMQQRLNCFQEQLESGSSRFCLWCTTPEPRSNTRNL